MNLTPKEAAAKYRSLEYRGLGAWYTPDGECLDYEEVAALRHALAEAYLEQNPADDEEAIDEAWLKELGFEINGEFWDLVVPNIAGYPTKISVMPNGGEWAVFLIQSDWIDDSDEADWGDSSCVQVNRITTRRDLRCLLRGMGHDRKGNR